MKNHITKILLTAFVTMLVLSVQSQNFNYGIIVGADITNMHLSNAPTTASENMFDPLLSYNLNGFISYKSDFFLGASAEPGIIRKGGVQLFDYLNSQSQPVNQKVIASITSLQLPLLLDIHISKRLYVSAGVELEYRISQKAVMTDEPTTHHVFAGSYPLYVVRKTGADTNGNDILPDKNYPSMYYSSLVGLQYKINKRFDVGLRYGRSLKKLYSVLWVDEFNAAMGHSNLHTSYLQLSLRVRL